jgi:hypothetical protein
MAGFTIGAGLLVEKALTVNSHWYLLTAAHRQTLLFGWTVQLVYGVAFWILPTFGRNRGWIAPVVLALICVNLGVIASSLEPWFSGLALLGWSLEAVAGMAFLIHAWPRVKAFGSDTN